MHARYHVIHLELDVVDDEYHVLERETHMRRETMTSNTEFAEHNSKNPKGAEESCPSHRAVGGEESFRVRETWSDGSKKRPRPNLVQMPIRESGKQKQFNILTT